MTDAGNASEPIVACVFVRVGRPRTEVKRDLRSRERSTFVTALVPSPMASLLVLICSASAMRAPAERKWSRATAGESPPQRATRLDAHREHQARQKQRHLARLDRLLQNAHKKLAEPLPCGQHDIDWDRLPPGCDPCGVATKMRAGTLRGDRKRESISAMAHLLESSLLPQVAASPRPTVVDAGCGTGSLLLPLAALFPSVRFVGVDTKAGSLDRFRMRAARAEFDSTRVQAWQGLIEDYDGPCDCVLSLHACGGASDAALRLAADRSVPFAISPCCIGKLVRGPASAWLKRQLAEVCGAEQEVQDVPSEVSTNKLFALLAAWADSEHVAPVTGSAGSEDATRRQRCKLIVEHDRLSAKGERSPAATEGAGRILRISGSAMRTSTQVEVLTGPWPSG